MYNAAEINEKQSKQEYAYQVLKEMILSNQLPADTSLVERQLCDMLNLSRTPIKAALQALENDGLVVTYKGRGCVVSRIQIGDFVEVFQLRSALDLLALKLFMQKNNGEIVKKLHSIVDDMAEFLAKEDYASFVQCDSAFHDCYFYNTGNKRLERIMAMISDQIRRILNLTASDREQCRKSYQDHCLMLEAIEAGDIARATELLSVHISDSLEYHVRKITRFD